MYNVPTAAGTFVLLAPLAHLIITHHVPAAASALLPIATPQVEGPPRRSVGRRALRGLLTHNPDLFDTCLDKAYDTNTSIANGYFQVRSGAHLVATEVLPLLNFMLTCGAVGKRGLLGMKEHSCCACDGQGSFGLTCLCPNMHFSQDPTLPLTRYILPAAPTCLPPIHHPRCCARCTPRTPACAPPLTSSWLWCCTSWWTGTRRWEKRVWCVITWWACCVCICTHWCTGGRRWSGGTWGMARRNGPVSTRYIGHRGGMTWEFGFRLSLLAPFPSPRSPQVREDAMHMLHVLTLREWPETDGSYSFLVSAPSVGAAAAAAAAARGAPSDAIRLYRFSPTDSIVSAHPHAYPHALHRW